MSLALRPRRQRSREHRRRETRTRSESWCIMAMRRNPTDNQHGEQFPRFGVAPRATHEPLTTCRSPLARGISWSSLAHCHPPPARRPSPCRLHATATLQDLLQRNKASRGAAEERRRTPDSKGTMQSCAHGSTTKDSMKMESKESKRVSWGHASRMWGSMTANEIY